MKQVQAQKQESMHKITPTTNLSTVHADSGSAGLPLKQNRPARFFQFWRGIGQQVNDNSSRAAPGLHVRFAVVAVLLGLLMGLNSSTIMTQAVLHADDSVLSAAMQTSPDALAYALNKMDVGE